MNLACNTVIEAELDFIVNQAARHPHHYYAMNHFNFLSPNVPDELAFRFIKIMIQQTPLHYGVYHHLLRRSQHMSLGELLDFVSVSIDFQVSESFCQFVYCAVISRPAERAVALAALPGESRWPVHFRQLILAI